MGYGYFPTFSFHTSSPLPNFVSGLGHILLLYKYKWSEGNGTAAKETGEQTKQPEGGTNWYKASSTDNDISSSSQAYSQSGLRW